jgi:hypothetical protein
MNKTRKISKNKSCKISLITVSTKQHPDLERYKKSAEAHGFKPHILGLKENRSAGHSNSKFGIKLKYLLKYVKSLKENDIVLFTDAWDVIIVEDCSEIIRKYKSFKKDIVIGAEKYCWPDWFLFYKFNCFDAPFPYLNSGGIIGKAGIIKDLLEEYYKGEDAIDDQRLWTKIYLENKSKIGLDEKAEIFLNTCWVKHNNIIYKDNRLYYKETKTFPSIIHINGKNKSYEALIRY